MARFQHKRLDQPDEVRPYPLGQTEIFELDDFVVGRMVMEPGWRWTHDVRPIAGTERCMYHHLGYCISGALHIELEDGTTGVIKAGEMFELPPGHEAWVEEGTEPWIAVDFRGARSYAGPWRRARTGSWPPCCSRTSSIRPSSCGGWATPPGGTWSVSTTSW